MAKLVTYFSESSILPNSGFFSSVSNADTTISLHSAGLVFCRCTPITQDVSIPARVLCARQSGENNPKDHYEDGRYTFKDAIVSNMICHAWVDSIELIRLLEKLLHLFDLLCCRSRHREAVKISTQEQSVSSIFHNNIDHTSNAALSIVSVLKRPGNE